MYPARTLCGDDASRSLLSSGLSVSLPSILIDVARSRQMLNTMRTDSGTDQNTPAWWVGGVLRMHYATPTTAVCGLMGMGCMVTSRKPADSYMAFSSLK